MAKLSRDQTGVSLHPRETLFASGVLASAGAELQVAADGAASVGLHITGTYVGTFAVEGTIDGTNWVQIPIRPAGTFGIWILVTASAAQGAWQGQIGPFRTVRVRMTAWTSGAPNVTLVADTAPNDILAIPKPSDQTATATGAAAAAVTLSIGAPGSGLFQHITRLLIQRIAAAALTAGATPTIVTTTNLPGARAFSIPADAAAQGVIYDEEVNLANPLRASAANTAVTIVMPVTTGVIWRATADYFNAP